MLAAFGIIAGYFGGQRRNTRLITSSFNGSCRRRAGGDFCWHPLVRSFTGCLQLSYVWNHSERALPTFYKVFGALGGQAGSLLFWCLLLSGFSAVVAFANRHKHQV